MPREPGGESSGDGDAGAALAILDEDGAAVALDPVEAMSLLALTRDLEAATISACPGCRSRILACLALVDLLADSAPHPRAEELIELAEDAPSSHCYVHDLETTCRHRRWLDPGRLEWVDVVLTPRGPSLGPRH